MHYCFIIIYIIYRIIVPLYRVYINCGYKEITKEEKRRNIILKTVNIYRVLTYKYLIYFILFFNHIFINKIFNIRIFKIIDRKKILYTYIYVRIRRICQLI
jgi:hypothetical protein